MLPLLRTIPFTSRTRVTAFVRTCSTLINHFPQSTASDLAQRGHATFDAALSPSTTAQLRAEIDLLASAGHLRPNETHISRGSAARVTFPKTGVYEAELSQLPEQALSSTPTLVALRDDPTLRALLSVLWPRLTLHEHALKVQRANGNAACFPIHVDSAADVDGRVVTALLYLNAGWDGRVDGGALRLYDSPVSLVDVAPADGRLVLLAARGLHHRVVPAQRPRYVITVWCSGSVRAGGAAQRTRAAQRSEAEHDEEEAETRLARLLLAPRLRDMTFRLVLADEWECSLWEAHAAAVAAQAVEMHRANLALIRRRLPDLVRRELGETAATLDVARLFGQPERLVELFRRAGEREPASLSFQWG